MTSDTPRMPACRGDPWLTVYALGQFAFCNRAGLIAVRDKQDEDVEDDDTNIAPHLAVRASRRFQVPYSLRRIETMLARCTAKIVVSGIAAILSTLTLIVLSFQSKGAPVTILGFVPIATCVTVLFISCKFAISQRPLWRQLITLREFARNTKPAEPDMSARQPQRVNWWSLIRAGFDSRPSREIISFESWRIAGKPSFRILQKGNVRIPVFRLKDDREKVYTKDYVRAAAYCKLLESTGAQSPYAVALFRDTYDCLVIPNSPGSRKRFHETLRRARAIVRSGIADEPINTNVCSRCIHGKPYDEFEVLHLGGQPLTPYRAVSTRKGFFHSVCGDVFNWVPGHEQARGLGLVSEEDARVASNYEYDVGYYDDDYDED